MLALLPACIALLNFQRELQIGRGREARFAALQQAQMLHTSLGVMVEGAHKVMTAITLSDLVATLDSHCGPVLAELQTALSSYVFFAVTDHEGSLICGSGPSLPPEHLRAIAQGAAPGAFAVGGYHQMGEGLPAVLSLSLPFATRDGTRHGLVLAGLSVAWLGEFVRSMQRPVDGILSVVDRTGVVVAREPNPTRWVGQPVLPEVRPLLDHAAPGTAIVTPPSGRRRVIGYVPDTIDPAGLFVSAGFLLGTLTQDIDAGASRGYVTIAIAAAVSLILSLMLSQRFVQAPTRMLLRVTRAFGQGDLSTRAAIPRWSATEFQQIGDAFNAMAATLEQQRSELQSLNDELEARVDERTQALLASNTQLQVEISEREETERRLRQVQKLQAVGQLASGIAHEFNNLLTAMVGSLELLRRRIATSEPDVARLLDTATSAVDRATRLTAKLLGFARQHALLSVPIDVAETIEGMAALLATTLGVEIWLETRLSPDLWTTAVDPNQFETAILNLALNARDAMPHGGRLLISASNRSVAPDQAKAELPAGDYVNVTVTDSGRGMSEEVLSRAFEPFFTTQGMGQAAGLGLSQVHGLARQSGGDVRIESRVGQGTRVTMSLPRTLQAPVRYASMGPASLPLQSSANRAVLLVDDDDDVRDVTASLLMDGGFTVIQAANAPAALVRLADAGKRIGFVVADYAMPGMNGHDLLTSIRQTRPDLPVLLITGYAEAAALTEAGLPRGYVMHKPFRGADLIARIESLWQSAGQATPPAP